MKVTIQVTQQHIAAGIPGHACKCPIASAIAPYVNQRYQVMVDNDGNITAIDTDDPAYSNPIYFKRGTKRRDYDPVRGFVYLFDKEATRGNARAFSFALEIPDFMLAT